MMTGQLTIQLHLQPLSAFVMLAIRTMSIATAAVYHVPFTALGALIDTSAVMIRAAIDDGVDDLFVLIGHGITETLDILRAVGIKDVFNCRHGQILSLFR